MSFYNDIGKLVQKLKPLLLIIEHTLIVQINDARIFCNKRLHVTSKPRWLKPVFVCKLVWIGSDVFKSQS